MFQILSAYFNGLSRALQTLLHFRIFFVCRFCFYFFAFLFGFVGSGFFVCLFVLLDWLVLFCICCLVLLVCLFEMGSHGTQADLKTK